MKKLASHISNAQKAGYNIANKDKYHGQYNFLGRLLAPIQFTDSKLLEGWLNKNPKSKVISYHYIFQTIQLIIYICLKILFLLLFFIQFCGAHFH